MATRSIKDTGSSSEEIQTHYVIQHSEFDVVNPCSFAKSILTGIKSEEWALIVPKKQDPRTIHDLFEAMAHRAYKHGIKLEKPTVVQINNTFPESYVLGIDEAAKRIGSTLKIFVIVLRGDSESRCTTKYLTFDHGKYQHKLPVLSIRGEYIEDIEGETGPKVASLVRRMIRRIKEYGNNSTCDINTDFQQDFNFKEHLLGEPAEFQKLPVLCRENPTVRFNLHESFFKNFLTNKTENAPDILDPASSYNYSYDYESFFKD